MQHSELNQQPKPAAEFELWNHKTLAQFASDATAEIIALRGAVEQLRTDLRDAMRLVRENNRA